MKILGPKLVVRCGLCVMSMDMNENEIDDGSRLLSVRTCSALLDTRSGCNVVADTGKMKMLIKK